MATTCNMHSNKETNINTEIKNKGFDMLDTMFKEHGWHMIKNEINWIAYTKFGRETELFDIKIDKKTNYYYIFYFLNVFYNLTYYSLYDY